MDTLIDNPGRGQEGIEQRDVGRHSATSTRIVKQSQMADYRFRIVDEQDDGGFSRHARV